MTTPAPLRLASTLLDALLYPLHFHSSLFIVVSSFLLWLLSASLFGIVAVLALATAIVRFLLISLRNSALGETLPPMLTSDDLVRPGSTPVKLLLTVLVWVSVAKQAAVLSASAGMLLTALGYMLLPAFTTLLVLEDSLRYALSPPRLLRFAIRGGLPYLLLAIALAASLYFGIGGLGKDISAKDFSTGLVLRMPQPAALAWLTGGVYLATSFAHLLGKLASHAHDFHPPAEHSIVRTEEPEPDSAAVIAAELSGLLRQGDREVVLAAWETHAERDAYFHSTLLEMLVRERAWALVPQQAQRTISKQLLANRQIAALQSAMHVLNDFESFRTSTAKEWLALCETAMTSERGEWLKLLACKAPEKFPGAAELLDIALLHARYLANRDNNLENALQALRPHLQQLDHPRHPELLRLNAALQTIQAH